MTYNFLRDEYRHVVIKSISSFPIENSHDYLEAQSLLLEKLLVRFHAQISRFHTKYRVLNAFFLMDIVKYAIYINFNLKRQKCAKKNQPFNL